MPSPHLFTRFSSTHPASKFPTLLRTSFRTLLSAALMAGLAACGGGGGGADGVASSACTDCNSNAGSVTLTWDPVPGAVLGYLVYFADGLVYDPASITTIITSNSVSFDTRTDLGLTPGDYACFWVQSVNQAGVSSLSAPVCGVV